MSSTRKKMCGEMSRAFGGVIPVTLRDRYREFASGRAHKLYVRYDEVRDWDRFQEIVLDRPDVAFTDHPEGVTVWEEENVQ